MTAYPAETIAAYHAVTTATLTTVLLKKGLRNIWVRGSFPLQPGQKRVAGPAFTLRFIPSREDLATPESAIEAMPEGCVAVIAADGCTDAGVFGDILCARMAYRHVAAMVTDGVVRDRQGVLDTGLSVWSAGAAAPPSVAGLTFVNWQEPLGCGGVAILPNDLIVADDDGVIVVPSNLVDEVLEIAVNQEALEEWILDEVKGGATLPGLYPPNEDNRRRYEAQKTRR